MKPWTGPERDLLRALALDIGHCIAAPEDAIADFRRGTHSGGGHGFTYTFTATALHGQWHEHLIDRRHADGTPYRWKQGPLQREAVITYTRLHRWCQNLPPAVREQALHYWRVHPVDTRDLPALARLTLTAIDSPRPKPPPAQALSLFDIPEPHHTERRPTR